MSTSAELAGSRLTGICFNTLLSAHLAPSLFFFFLKNAPLSFHPFQTSKNQIKVELVDENFTELKGEIAGPPDTPYEGEAALPARFGYVIARITDCNLIFKDTSPTDY